MTKIYTDLHGIAEISMDEPQLRVNKTRPGHYFIRHLTVKFHDGSTWDFSLFGENAGSLSVQKALS